MRPLLLLLLLTAPALAENETTVISRFWFPTTAKVGTANKLISMTVKSTEANDGLIFSVYAYDKASPITKVVIAHGSGVAMQTCMVPQPPPSPTVNYITTDNGDMLTTDSGDKLTDGTSGGYPMCQYTWLIPRQTPPISWYNDITITVTNAANKSFTLPIKAVRPYGLPY